MKRFNIFAGNYGSGKTEISLNTALKLAQTKQTTLVDMDVVNPYFRSAESEELLKEHGVRLIAPPYANTNVDVPVLSAEVMAAFESETAVFDAGGDPVGAAALGGLLQKFQPVREETMLYYVVNARRPLQRTAEEIIDMMGQISARVRLKIDGIINNTNLGRESSVQDLLHGQKVCEQVSAKTDTPIVYVSGKPEILAAFSEAGYTIPQIPLSIYTFPDWLVDATHEK
ncbi:MAG: hypothetical protein VB081_02910 [Christensenella sp.]|uniref:hypothetical protein n=1 Tax=Christensenella sp. TaxID=1935934 RepID=UPI002B1EE860|nr:hypothetical protein [Christensenella sp.]MEA5002425.1 hypothetical protein [Christensenella sp.]